MRWLSLGLVLAAALFWSTAGLFITTTVRGSGISAMGLAFWRVFFSFLCLLVGIVLIHPSALRIRLRDLPWLAGMGILAVGTFQVLWILAILTNGASVSTVIQCNAPVIVTLLAWLFWREPLTWQKWAAIALASVGTILVSGLTGAGNLPIKPEGLLISLGSALAYAAITLFAKKLTGYYNGWVVLTYSLGFAALALLPLQMGRLLPPFVSGQGVAAFSGLVLLTTIAGYASYMRGLRHLQASVAAILAMAEVPFAALFGYLLLGERLSGWQVVGGLLVISGVVLLSARTPAARRAPATTHARA